jgi:hypothetical protein
VVTVNQRTTSAQAVHDTVEELVDTTRSLPNSSKRPRE